MPPYLFLLKKNYHLSYFLIFPYFINNERVRTIKSSRHLSHSPSECVDVLEFGVLVTNLFPENSGKLARKIVEKEYELYVRALSWTYFLHFLASKGQLIEIIDLLIKVAIFNKNSDIEAELNNLKAISEKIKESGKDRSEFEIHFMNHVWERLRGVKTDLYAKKGKSKDKKILAKK